MREIQAGFETVRPGRELFVREWILGDGDEQKQQQQQQLDNNDINDADDIDLQLVLIHGMCATELQYHDMLYALEKEMLVEDSNNKKKKKRKPFKIHCVMYDMVGCGQSPTVKKWKAYSRSEHIQDLQAIMERGRTSLSNFKNKQNHTKAIPTILVAHSYGPSIVVSWLSSLKRQQQPPSMDLNIRGLVFLSTSLRDDELPFPDGGPWVFHYLPVSVLRCLQPPMTADFLNRAVHEKHTTLKQAIRLAKSNDMYMVKAFHTQAKWATPNDLKNALEVLQNQQEQEQQPSIRCLVVHGADDGLIDIQQGQKLANRMVEQSQQQQQQSSSSNAVVEVCNGGKVVVIDEASHMIMLEQPTMVARAILEYIYKSFQYCSR